MKKLNFSIEEQQIIIELLIEDLRTNINYLVSHIDPIAHKKKSQNWVLLPTLDVLQKIQKGLQLKLNTKEQAAISRSIKTRKNENDNVEYLQILKSILSKTK